MDVSSWWVPYINSWKKYCSHTIFLFNIRTKKSVGQKIRTKNSVTNIKLSKYTFLTGLEQIAKIFCSILGYKRQFPRYLPRQMNGKNNYVAFRFENLHVSNVDFLQFILCCLQTAAFTHQRMVTHKSKNHIWNLTPETNMN